MSQEGGAVSICPHYGRILAPLFIVGLFIVGCNTAHAAMLMQLSDTITDSAPSATTTSHAILFTASTTIPAGGTIIITPEGKGTASTSFNIPAAFDFNDIDLAVATGGGPFIDRSLAAVPSPTDEGVSSVPGIVGSITITLGSGVASPIPSGGVVLITIGPKASVGGVGVHSIDSPGIVDSYHVRFETHDASDAPLDYGSTLIAIVDPIAMGPVDTTDIIPVIRSNGLPSGLLPGGTTNVLISLNTNKLATCRYSPVAGTAYAAMAATTTFTSANIGLLHYQVIPVVDLTTYSFYVRCVNNSGVPNPDDFLITFDMGVVPTAPPPPPQPPGPSGSGGGGMSGGQYLNGSDVTLNGQGIPSALLVILKDGVSVKETSLSSIGTFNEQFTDLDRGTYVWGLYAKDQNGVLTSIYSSTIYLQGKTSNLIAPIYLSPTIRAATTTVGLGDPIVVSGFAIPLSPVQVIMNVQGNILNGKIISATTTANGNGSWTLSLSTDGLAKDTYEIKAQSLIGLKDHSVLSPTIFVGLGEAPNPDFKKRSDLNKDGKVNLVDFSILLFHWGTNDLISDINQDGKVSLVDFSIMLANWTG